MSTVASGSDSSSHSEFGISPHRQERKPFQPRSDLVGEYSSFSEKGPSYGRSSDPMLNAKWDEQQQVWENERKRRKLLTKEEQQKEDDLALKAEIKYKKGERLFDANEKRNNVPSDMGFGKAGEVNTDGDAPDPNEQEDDPLEGFQIIARANEDIIKRRQAKIDQDIDEGKLGTIEDPAPATITLEENDHNIGVESRKGDDLDRDFQPLENRFSEIVTRKGLKRINIDYNEKAYGDNKIEKVYDTRVIVDRISNRRQKDWLKNHNGEKFIVSVWEHAILIELLVDKKGNSCVLITSDEKDLTSRDQNQNKRLKIDTKDFFTMFSVPSEENGRSCFESRKFRPDKLGDREKLTKFFEHVTLRGKKAGDRKDGSLPPIKIKPWTSAGIASDRPKEATQTQKDLAAGKPVGFENDYYDSKQIVKPWNQTNLNGNAFDDPMWPKNVEQESKKGSAPATEEQNIKRLRKRLAEEEQYRKDRLIAHLNRVIDKAQEENRKLEV